MNMESVNTGVPLVREWSKFVSLGHDMFRDLGPQHRRDWRPSQKKIRLNNRRSEKFGKGKR